MRLGDKAASFTGSASAIGTKISFTNVRERAQLADLNGRGAGAVAAELVGDAGRAIGIAVDIKSEVQVGNRAARACGATEPSAQRPPLTHCLDSVLPCGPCKARVYGVCSTVAHSDLTRLAAVAAIVEVARGQTFIHEDAPAEHFCILIQGSAKLYKLLADGRRQIIGFEYSGGFLGLAASNGYAFSAEAIEPIRMCRMSRRKLLAVLGGSQAAERCLLDVAVRDLVRAQEQMLLLGRKTATERMASFLLCEATRPQPRGVQRPRIHLPMSRSDIADYLGLNVETISRTLAKLRKSGVIAIPNIHELVILDLSCLEALARGSLTESASDDGGRVPDAESRISKATSSAASRRSPGAAWAEPRRSAL